MKLLFDINVILDVLLERQPFVTNAAALLNAVELGQIHGYLAPHAVTTIYYLVAKHLDQASAREVVARLLRLFDIAIAGRVVFDTATRSKIHDFEDAVQAEYVLHLGLDAIVTRNLDDYHAAGVIAYSPGEVVAWLHRQSADEG